MTSNKRSQKLKSLKECYFYFILSRNDTVHNLDTVHFGLDFNDVVGRVCDTNFQIC